MGTMSDYPLLSLSISFRRRINTEMQPENIQGRVLYWYVVLGARLPENQGPGKDTQVSGGFVLWKVWEHILGLYFALLYWWGAYHEILDHSQLPKRPPILLHI